MDTPERPQDVPPTENERRIWGVYCAIANRIGELVEASQTRDQVAAVLKAIHCRLLNSISSLNTLIEHAKHDFRFDAASILRTVYDVHLQGLYIMSDSARRVDRASLFNDFVAVEQHKLRQMYDRNQTEFARSISQVANRAQLQAQAEQVFNSVKHRFVMPKRRPSDPDRFRKHWYGDNLSVVATDVGYQEEYEILQRLLSAPVHSTPHALLFGPPMKRSTFMNYACRFAFRVLGKVLEYHQIPTTSEIERCLVLGSYERFDRKPFVLPPHPAS